MEGFERADAVATRQARTWSLRQEWSRAFIVMVALLLLVASATIMGVRGVVSEVQGTARQMNRESVAVAALQAAVVAHEEIAHRLLSDKPVDRAGFLRQQDEIAAEFGRVVAIFPPGSTMRATTSAARRSWQQGLVEYGLWGSQVTGLHGDHSAENPVYGASSDATVALLDGLEGPSLAEMDSGLNRGAELERALIGVLVLLFGFALAATVYFRRRMTRDLVRPVASLRHGVQQVQAGIYDQPIPVARRDELGELADAFNEMAAALHESHRALTVRATRDWLTGLANRATLTEYLVGSFVADTKGRELESLLFIDIDDFKNVNDSLGHAAGDDLLVQLSARLQTCVREEDLLARLGGDEFALVVLDEVGGGAAVAVAERILAALSTPFQLAGRPTTIAVSIGIAQRLPQTADAAELLRQADFAMYMAKGAGKNQYQLFDPHLHENMIGAAGLPQRQP